MRLDRMLSECGWGTRNEVKKMIRGGWVEVNGVTEKKADRQIDPEKDTVTADGTEVVYEQYVYFMLNKPAGYISATEGNVPTVLDLIGEPYRGLFPCGRLDKDTTGLLLITNDGALAHRLLSPKHHVEKEYIVDHREPLSENDIARLESGISYQKEAYKPAVYQKISETRCSLTITEGRYHEIKLMFEALGNEVTALKRIRMKNLVLDESLAEGEYRRLTDEEREDLSGQS